MYGQQFIYPNAFIPGNISGAGTLEGGQATESEATGGDAK